MDLPPPPPPALTIYADVKFHQNETLPDYPQRRGETAPSAAKIEQARNVYPNDPTEALKTEGNLINWGTRPISPNHCPAKREAPPIMPVFGNDRPEEALRYNVLCISSLEDVPPVIDRNVKAVLFTTVWAATAPLGVAGDVLGLPVVLIHGTGNILFGNSR